MRRRVLLSLPFAAAMLSGCTRSRRQNEVFAGYLRSAVEQMRTVAASRGDGGKSPIRLVVQSQVSSHSALLNWKDVVEVKQDLPSIQASTASDLLMHRNDVTAVQLPSALLPSEMQTDYITPRRIRTLFESLPLQRAWDRFYEIDPGAGGLTSFSPVGFSADGRQAAFVVGVGCGGLCGVGMGVLMRRSAVGWTVDQQQQIWVS